MDQLQPCHVASVRQPVVCMAAQLNSSKFPEQFKPGKAEEQSFRADWCEKYEWLHYDAEKDAAF